MPVSGHCDNRLLVEHCVIDSHLVAPYLGHGYFAIVFFNPLAVGILKIDLVDTVGTEDSFSECAFET